MWQGLRARGSRRYVYEESKREKMASNLASGTGPMKKHLLIRNAKTCRSLAR
jgi:hypothetical protein